MTTHRLAPYNVVGVFGSLPAASDALDALSEAGFSADGELSLLGPEHEMRPSVDHVTETQGGAASGTAAGLAVGVGTGGAVGAALTSLAAVAATAIPGVGLAVGAAALIGAVSGATGGSTVGALLGLEAAGRRSTMWQQTLSPLLSRVTDEHVVLVAVHVAEEDRANEAQALLDDRADEVHLLGADVDYTPELRESNIGVTVPSGSADDPGGVMGPGKDDHELPNT